MTQPTRDRAAAILAGLGGIANIAEIDPCATRLRSRVKEPGLVDRDALKDAGALAVIANAHIVQIVLGPEAEEIADEIAAHVDG